MTALTTALLTPALATTARAAASDPGAPAAARITTPASPSADRQPRFTISSADPGVTATCQVAGPSGPLGPLAACPISDTGTTYDVDLASVPDGAYVLTVQVTDAAGTAGPDAQATYVLDTTAPSAVALTALTPGPSAEPTPSWTLAGDADASLECELGGPGLTTPTFTPCPAAQGDPGTASFTADLTDKPDGTFSLTARSRDAAGNLGPDTTSSYELDRTAPAAPVVTSPSDQPSQDPSPVWTFAVGQGATALCSLSSATAVVTPEAPCTSPLTTPLPTDGSFVLSVRATDPAGNVSAAATSTYALDRVAPEPPRINQTPGSPGPVHDPTWGVETTEPGGTLQCWLTGVDTGWRLCPSPLTYELLPARNGSFVLRVRQVDAAGNASASTLSAPYVYDAAAPMVPDVVPPTSPSSSTHPVFHVQRHPGDTDTVALRCTVERFDGAPAAASPCAFGDTTIDLSDLTGQHEGAVVLKVRGVDSAGNESGEATASYRFDSAPPVAPRVLPLRDPVSLSTRVTWTFGNTAAETQHDPVSYRCAVARRGVTAASSAACSSPEAVSLPAPGTWTLWIWAVDAAGNASTPARSDDTLLPPVPSVSDLRAPAAGPDSSPTWTFSLPHGAAQARCLVSDVRGTAVGSGECTTGRFTVDLLHAPAGAYALTLQLRDSHGNAGRWSKRSRYDFAPGTTVAPPGRPGPVVHPRPGTPSGRPAARRPARPRRPPSVPPARVGGRGVPLVLGRVVVASSSRTPSRQSRGSSSRSAGSVELSLGPQPAFITRAVPEAIKQTLRQAARKPTIPLLLLVVVGGFLLLQNRIDRRDPKLATAPVGPEPELDFGPVRSAPA